MTAVVGAPTWWERTHGEEDGFLAAYFSMEFGLDARLPIYAGGLGVLAGDHLKSAAALGVPLVGVGLLYRCGYFEQAVEGGGQVEAYPRLDPAAAGLVREPASLEVELAGERAEVAVWRRDVGRVALYLLDSDAVLPTLYGGDREDRIRQEVLLGIGGTRALAALGLAPTVFHLNEGHAAFAFVERIRTLVEEDGVGPDEALEAVRRSTVFTTHTPVPAGNETFDPDLVGRYLGDLVARCGISWDAFVALGGSGGSEFGLTPLALRTAAHANGVSRLHGDVARGMWRGLWPAAADDSGVPIGHVTNGVHAPTWLSDELARELRDLGADPDAPPGEESWERVATLEADAFERVYARRKSALLDLVFARTGRALDPATLTLGLARRFATYKRADLLFRDVDRLAALPVQVVVAGKAHPHDEEGKGLLRRVAALADDPRLDGRVVFVPDYDLETAALLVQGADVWLNTPTRPLEASGTSGMKAGMNGVLNVSVLDGWWAEAYSPDLGWAIEGRSDEEDAAALLRLLESEVVPAYYDDRLRWLAMVRTSIERVGRDFNSHRMVSEYADRYYAAAHRARRARP